MLSDAAGLCESGSLRNFSCFVMVSPWLASVLAPPLFQVVTKKRQLCMSEALNNIRFIICLVNVYLYYVSQTSKVQVF